MSIENPELAVGQDRLHDLFTLPTPYSTNEAVVRWYNEIIIRMTREASGLPMQVNQIQLLERIAFLYAVMRYREINGESVSIREQKEINTEWRAMLDTFNRSIEKHKDQILRDTVLTIQDAIREVLSGVEDENLAKTLNRELIEKFAEKGL